MDIDTGISKPMSQRPYTLPLKPHEWVKKEIKQLECAGIIERSFSHWASPIIIVPKKLAPGEPPKRRMCVQTQIDTISKSCMRLYTLPKIDKMFAKLCGAKNFTMLDLCSGYYHIGLSEEVKPKTAFVTPHSKWHFNIVLS